MAERPTVSPEEVWCLLYLVDWEPVREDGSKPIFPDVHGWYSTWQEAEAIRRQKIHPERYWVRKAKRLTGAGY